LSCPVYITNLSLTSISTCIVSVLRLVWLYPISITKDVTYESPLSALWSNVELNVGILCSCVPTLRSCMIRLFPSLVSQIASSGGTQQETKPSSTASQSKRMTVQEIALPHLDTDLEQQHLDNDPHGHDPRKQPFSFHIACTTHDSSDAVHLTTLRAPPTIALSKMHSRKASLPGRVAKWRESQGQKTPAPQQPQQQAPHQHQHQQHQQQQQQQQRRYPNNDSMKNLLSEEIETMPAIPERSPERALSRDGR
jgi:hypothetical protein